MAPGTQVLKEEPEKVGRVIEDLCSHSVLSEQLGFEMRGKAWDSAEKIDAEALLLQADLPVTSPAAGSRSEIHLETQHFLNDTKAFPNNVRPADPSPNTKDFDNALCRFRGAIEQVRGELERDSEVAIAPPMNRSRQIRSLLRKFLDLRFANRSARKRFFVDERFVCVDGSAAAVARSDQRRHLYLPASYTKDPVPSRLNPSRGLASFNAWDCNSDGVATATIKDGSKVSAAFDLCLARNEATVPY